MKKALFINPFGIGDVLFTTPLIRQIKEKYPDALIGYWCNERVRAVLANDPRIDIIFPLSRGDIKKIYRNSLIKGIRSFLGLIAKIKKEHFDISLDFSLDHRYSLISKLSGIKRRIGFNYKNRGRFLTDKIDIEGYENKHVVDYYLGLLEFIGIKPQDARLELTVTQESKERAAELLKDSGLGVRDFLVGIAPGGGASWGREALLKHWPAKNFAQLADRITDNFGAKVVILGDDSERDITAMMVSEMKNIPVDLTGKTSLEGLAAVIDNLNILVANDAGPLHIAAALGKKTVSFFGPVDPLVYGPYPAQESQHVVLRKGLDCSPCYQKFRLNPCLRGKECLETISVQEALEAVGSLFSR